MAVTSPVRIYPSSKKTARQIAGRRRGWTSAIAIDEALKWYKRMLDRCTVSDPIELVVDSHPQSSVENHGSDRGRDVKPLAGGTESADSPLAGDDAGLSPSPLPTDSRSGGQPVSSTGDGTPAPKPAHGSAGLKLVGQSLAVSGGGDHAADVDCPETDSRD